MDVAAGALAVRRHGRKLRLDFHSLACAVANHLTTLNATPVLEAHPLARSQAKVICGVFIAKVVLVDEQGIGEGQSVSAFLLREVWDLHTSFCRIALGYGNLDGVKNTHGPLCHVV